MTTKSFLMIDLNNLSKEDLIRLIQNSVAISTTYNEAAYVLTTGTIQKEFNEKSLQSGLNTRWEDLTEPQQTRCINRAAEILSAFDWNEAVMELIHDLLDDGEERIEPDTDQVFLDSKDP